MLPDIKPCYQIVKGIKEIIKKHTCNNVFTLQHTYVYN